MRYLSAILLALLISTSLIAKPITENGKIVVVSSLIEYIETIVGGWKLT